MQKRFGVDGSFWTLCELKFLNTPFLCCLLPLFQNKSSFKTFHIMPRPHWPGYRFENASVWTGQCGRGLKIIWICMKINVQAWQRYDSFSYEWFGMKIRFDKEAKSNSEWPIQLNKHPRNFAYRFHVQNLKCEFLVSVAQQICILFFCSSWSAGTVRLLRREFFWTNGS